MTARDVYHRASVNQLYAFMVVSRENDIACQDPLQP